MSFIKMLVKYALTKIRGFMMGDSPKDIRIKELIEKYEEEKNKIRIYFENKF